jgi:hypothetical protein
MENANQCPSKDVANEKWTKAVMDAGYTIVPWVLLTKQDELGLDPLDMNILLQLAAQWFKAGGLCTPAKGTLATRLDVHPRTVQRRIAKLEKRRLLKRVTRMGADGQLSNDHDLKPLAAALHLLVVGAAKEKRQKGDERRRSAVGR